MPAGETGPDQMEFTVKGLTPGKKYKFRVRAVNKEGESDPLETTDAILAKNPYGEILLLPHAGSVIYNPHSFQSVRKTRL